MTDKIVIFSTCASADEAERIARALVEKRLAACVSVLPRMHSVYRWKGAVESQEEFQLVIKSNRALLDDARMEIEKLHSYEVPEVIAVPIVDGAERYLEWIDRELVEKREP
jgi:periplasmic divalent cation tolerance protein